MPSRWETLTVDNTPMRVYVATPKGGGTHAGVVIAHWGRGVDEFITTIADRLAEQGYVTVAPDLWHRLPNAEAMQPLDRIATLKDSEIITDMNAAVSFLQRGAELRAGRIGVMGFCMGGRVAYLMAAKNPALKAAAAFYPGNVTKPLGHTGPSPLEETSRIACPIIGFFGEDDANPSADDRRKLEEALKRHRKPHAFYAYPGAAHNFLAFNRPDQYREAAAKDAWGKLLAFFDQHLKMPAVVGS